MNYGTPLRNSTLPTSSTSLQGRALPADDGRWLAISLGLGFGICALIGLVVAVVLVLKRKRRNNLTQPAEPQTEERSQETHRTTQDSKLFWGPGIERIAWNFRKKTGYSTYDHPRNIAVPVKNDSTYDHPRNNAVLVKNDSTYDHPRNIAVPVKDDSTYDHPRNIAVPVNSDSMYDHPRNVAVPVTSDPIYGNYPPSVAVLVESDPIYENFSYVSDTAVYNQNYHSQSVSNLLGNQDISDNHSPSTSEYVNNASEITDYLPSIPVPAPRRSRRPSKDIK